MYIHAGKKLKKERKKTADQRDDYVYVTVLNKGAYLNCIAIAFCFHAVTKKKALKKGAKLRMLLACWQTA